MLLYVVIGFFLTTVLSYFLVAGIRRVALRRRILDIPNDRSSHTQPTPRGGGLAIAGLTLVGSALIWGANPVWSRSGIAGFWVGACLVAGISWLDDLRPLPSRLRFVVHLLAAGLALFSFGAWRVIAIRSGSLLDLGWIGLPLTLAWIVGLINAYNFMDGIDGLAGGQAVVAGLGWGLLGWLYGVMPVWVIGLLVAASSLGFLGHNWPPSKIFMGDIGSTFLGYSFAVLPLMAARAQAVPIFPGVLLLWPFIFDSGLTFARRLLHGEDVFSAHRSHLYQRLVISGLSHKQVALLYLGLSVLGGLVALVWEANLTAGGLGIASIVLASGLLVAAVAWSERRATRLRSQSGTPRPGVVN